MPAVTEIGRHFSRSETCQERVYVHNDLAAPLVYSFLSVFEVCLHLLVVFSALDFTGLQLLKKSFEHTNHFSRPCLVPMREFIGKVTLSSEPVPAP
jgi:hypothetical protein